MGLRERPERKRIGSMPRGYLTLGFAKGPQPSSGNRKQAPQTPWRPGGGECRRAGNPGNTAGSAKTYGLTAESLSPLYCVELSLLSRTTIRKLPSLLRNLLPTHNIYSLSVISNALSFFGQSTTATLLEDGSSTSTATTRWVAWTWPSSTTAAGADPWQPEDPYRPPEICVTGHGPAKWGHVRCHPHPVADRIRRSAAAEQLLPLVYDELRKLAAAKLAHEKPGQTLQATALVHEAYLRLVGPAGPVGPEAPSRRRCSPSPDPADSDLLLPRPLLRRGCRGDAADSGRSGPRARQRQAGRQSPTAGTLGRADVPTKNCASMTCSTWTRPCESWPRSIRSRPSWSNCASLPASRWTSRLRS